MQVNLPICTFSWEDTVPSLRRTDTAVGLARCRMTQHLSRTKEHTLSDRERYFHTCSKPSTECEGSYLLVRKSSSPKVHPYAAQWGFKDCALETAFPYTDYSKDYLSVQVSD